MVILLTVSVYSWSIIIQRSTGLKFLLLKSKRFQKTFDSGNDLTALYRESRQAKRAVTGLEFVFQEGFKEFARAKQLGLTSRSSVENSQRAMRVAIAKELDGAEKNVSILATISSISPYVGLLGTVWGIMNSLHALGSVQQASISMVAPGISEALIATAMGLFVAIPAGVAYNRFTHKIDSLANCYVSFQDELSNILQRQVQATVKA